MPSAQEIVAAHEAAGRRFEAAGVGSFVLEQGEGPPVVLFHGVPVSSFLYRKVIPPLAAAGFRALSFDFPGLGLAERPADFDYRWSGLATWAEAALDALGIERCHLVVHDVGGPIGFDLAVRHPERIASLTALDTPIDLATFHPPAVMRPFTIPVLGTLWLRGTPRRAYAELFYLQGIANRSAVPIEEVYAHYELLRRDDNGAAFLKIMRSFELGEERERYFREGLADHPYPAQVVWGERDPALGKKRRLAVQAFLGVDEPILLPAKHFLQEDHAPEIAEAVVSLARAAETA